ncbi:serine/threonine-protein kinase [Paratractidigestivibacter sp.]|uniref:serine/threonine protein kinase n=1 Tax=Paratractidigestivibacter sp. TaxID=2847316 RepID=UPI002ABD473D|nr:serine/threonine-protein kinase [Paratractidigestivibacter sp.]
MTAVGDVIGGKFEILSQVGHGGMSRVWLVRDRHLNKLWAAKEIGLAGREPDYEVVVQSLITEANLIKRLDHPMLPRVVDIIEEGRTIFVVMDYIEGTSLKQAMREAGRPMDEADVIEWGIQLCDVLEYLHSRKPPVIYRDMKPDNIMLREDGTVRLIDFGIAREYKEGKSSDTKVLGTRGYAAPEQFSHEAQTDARTDVYALGVTLYVLVTGRAASKETYWQPIRQINPALSEGLEHIIAKATQANPADRYQTASDMRYDLENYEKLTESYRSVLKKKLNRFNALWIGAAGLAVAGAACLGSSFHLKSMTYDAYLASARAASVEAAEADGVSAAEGYYTDAIGVDPSRTETYSELVDRVYKADQDFSIAESSRLQELVNAHRADIEEDDGYAKLCYDIGTLTYVYYEQAEGDESRDYAMSAGIQAAQWFQKAMESYDARKSANKGCALTSAERSTAQAYAIIGEFYQKLSQATLEGTEGSVYEGYWESLSDALEGLSDNDSVMVRLRLCSLINQAVSSPTYLSGFKRTGVTRDQAEELVGKAAQMAESLSADADSSTKAREMCDSVISDSARQVAESNIATVFGSAGANAAQKSAAALGGAQSEEAAQ